MLGDVGEVRQGTIYATADCFQLEESYSSYSDCILIILCDDMLGCASLYPRPLC